MKKTRWLTRPDAKNCFRYREDGAVDIKLSRRAAVIIDSIDLERTGRERWALLRGPRGLMYASKRKRLNGRRITLRLARLLIAASGNDVVVHINGDGLDCRRKNLAITDKNNASAKSRKRQGTTSGYKGVYWVRSKSKWAAKIKFEGRSIWLGYFEIEEDAARAYDEAAIKCFPKFARLNFPEEAA